MPSWSATVVAPGNSLPPPPRSLDRLRLGWNDSFNLAFGIPFFLIGAIALPIVVIFDGWLLAQLIQGRPVDDGMYGFLSFNLFPMGFGIPGSVCSFYGVRGWLRSRHIYRHGVAAPAIVTDVDRTMSSEGGKHRKRAVYYAHYEYGTPAGTFHGGHKSSQVPRPGEQIWVLYDPARPDRSIVY